jgi:hypothetical protein
MVNRAAQAGHGFFGVVSVHASISVYGTFV